jgi:FkbM family methyltransferase
VFAGECCVRLSFLVVQRIAAFLRCWYRQGLGNSVRLEIAKQGQTSLVPRGYQFPLTFRAHTVDVAVYRQVFVDREYDHKMLAEIHPKQIIDAGAHIGCASIFLAAKFPEARIIALEPDAANFELLKLNTKYYENIVPIHAALWYEDTQVRLTNPTGASWAIQVDGSNPNGNVKAVTLSSVLREFGIAKIDLLKMDVEGAEKEIFENNASDWLPRIGLLCIELHDRIRPGAARAVYSRAVAFPFVKENRGELDFLRFVDTRS